MFIRIPGSACPCDLSLFEELLVTDVFARGRKTITESGVIAVTVVIHVNVVYTTEKQKSKTW